LTIVDLIRKNTQTGKRDTKKEIEKMHTSSEIYVVQMSNKKSLAFLCFTYNSTSTRFEYKTPVSRRVEKEENKEDLTLLA